MKREKKERLEQTGGWSDLDGDLVFRRGMVLGGQRMIVSVVVLKHAVNGSLRLEAHDPESCATYQVFVSPCHIVCVFVSFVLDLRSPVYPFPRTSSTESPFSLTSLMTC